MLTYLNELQGGLARIASSITNELSQLPAGPEYLELRNALTRARAEVALAVASVGAAIQAHYLLPDAQKAWRRRV